MKPSSVLTEMNGLEHCIPLYKLLVGDLVGFKGELDFFFYITCLFIEP